MKLKTNELNESLENDSIEEPLHPSRKAKHCWGCRDKDDHGAAKNHTMNMHVRRFIRKNIGRPYDKVYSEFVDMVNANECFKSHRKNDWMSATKCFNSYIDDSKEVNEHICNRWSTHQFFIDKNGIIQTYHRDNAAHHKDHMFVRDGNDLFYLSNWYRQFRGVIYDSLSTRIGKGLAYDIAYGMVPRSVLTKVINSDDIVRDRMMELLKKLPSGGRRTCFYDSDPWNLFDHTISGTHITIRKKERQKMRAEHEDKRSKAGREQVASERAFNETLLHNICAKRKAMKDKDNAIKIQSHGFDEKTSFRGEGYHGQQRKKHANV